nr:MAG TPA: hypothetical protein [Caudoviricetes sp.]
MYPHSVRSVIVFIKYSNMLIIYVKPIDIKKVQCYNIITVKERR